MILNFGHTLGHAIESATNYKQLLHGEAVAWGSIAALHVALAAVPSRKQQADRVTALILRYGPLSKFKATAAKLVALTYADKKNRSGKRAYVLPTGIGSTKSSTTSPTPNSKPPPNPCSPSCAPKTNT